MRRKSAIIFSLISLCLAVGNTVQAQTLTGQTVMEKSFYRDDGEDSYLNVDMTLIDKKGNRRERQLEITAKDEGALRKTFLEFTAPSDIQGTRFLSWEEEGEDDTQYLYLPALGRSRRIVSSQKKLTFVNTDYTYEDMQRRRPDEDEHRLLREENFNGWPCYVVESVPKGKSSQYAKRIVWVGQESFLILKVDFYDKKDRLMKRFSVTELKQIQGIWTATKTLMDHFKDEHQTVMRAVDVIYNQGIDDNFFSLHKLEEN